MDTVIQGLRLAKMTLGLVPVSVPGLGPAVELALNIAELVEETKSAKDDCAALALRAAQLSLCIYDQLSRRGPDADMTTTTEPIVELLCALEGVEALMKRQAKKRSVVLLWKRQEIKDMARQLDKQLNHALELFEVQNTIATRQDLAYISTAQMHLVQHAEDAERVSEVLLKNYDDMKHSLVKMMQSVTVSTDDNGVMVLRREDLVWDEKMDLSGDDSCYESVDDVEQTTVQYRAHVEKTKTSLIVKFYSRQDESFRRIIRRREEITQRSRVLMPNPHIADIVAYSAPDLPYGFIAIAGGQEHTPFEEVFQKLHGVDRFLRTLDLAKQLRSAFEYLAKDLRLFKAAERRKDGGSFGTRQLYFTPEGNIRWDVHSWSSDKLPGLLCMDEGYLELGYEDQKAIKAVNVTRLRRLLDSPSSIDRAATMFILWDKLMEFTDFNRGECSSFSIVEDTPWIGGSIQTLVYDPYTPEGKRLFSAEKTDCVTLRRDAYIFPFNKDEPETEYLLQEPGDEYVYILGNRRLSNGPTLVTEERTTRDGHWRRHTVLNMDYSVGFCATQLIEESDKCRNFFMTQAVNLDVPRYVVDVPSEDGPLSIVNGLHIITSTHLVSLGPAPVGKPPSQLYFYTIQHDHHTICEFSTPWGYWSTSPEPIPRKDFPFEGRYEPERNRAFVKKYGIEVEYLGFSEKFKLAWMQTIEGFVFRIEVMVIVKSYLLTTDEHLMLHDVHKCITEAYEHNRRERPEVVRESVRRRRVLIEEDDSESPDHPSWRSKRRRLLK